MILTCHRQIKTVCSVMQMLADKFMWTTEKFSYPEVQVKDLKDLHQKNYCERLNYWRRAGRRSSIVQLGKRAHSTPQLEVVSRYRKIACR